MSKLKLATPELKVNQPYRRPGRPRKNPSALDDGALSKTASSKVTLKSVSETIDNQNSRRAGSCSSFAQEDMKLFIDKQNTLIENMKSTIDKQYTLIENNNLAMQDMNSTIDKQNTLIENMNSTIDKQNILIENNSLVMQDMKSTIDKQNTLIENNKISIQDMKSTIDKQNTLIENNTFTIQNLEINIKTLYSETMSLKQLIKDTDNKSYEHYQYLFKEITDRLDENTTQTNIIREINIQLLKEMGKGLGKGSTEPNPKATTALGVPRPSFSLGQGTVVPKGLGSVEPLPTPMQSPRPSPSPSRRPSPRPSPRDTLSRRAKGGYTYKTVEELKNLTLDELKKERRSAVNRRGTNVKRDLPDKVAIEKEYIGLLDGLIKGKNF